MYKIYELDFFDDIMTPKVVCTTDSLSALPSLIKKIFVDIHKLKNVHTDELVFTVLNKEDTQQRMIRKMNYFREVFMCNNKSGYEFYLSNLVHMHSHYSSPKFDESNSYLVINQ